MPDKVFVRKLPGHSFKALLESALSAYPKYEGRWPCISGVRLSFDPEKPAGQRILTLTSEDGSPFDLDKSYTLAVTDFIALGKDGFEAIVDPAVEELPPSPDEAFTMIDILKHFLRNFRRVGEELDRLKKTPFFPIFEKRLKLMHTSLENRCPETGWI